MIKAFQDATAPPGAKSKPSQALRENAKNGRANVLVVDDHKDSLVAMRAALSPLEQNIVECYSGEDALRQLLKMEFAVIILDVRLPGMDGFEIAGIIRERPKCSSTPIIFLTGLSKDKPQVFRGYSLGAVDYLIKPIDAEILRAKVQVFVDLHHKTDQVRQQTEQLFLMRERERESQREKERAAIEHKALLKEKEAAEALAEKAAELMRSNNELSQFAYIASHDLQEPVRTISSFTSLLLEEYAHQLDEEAKDYLSFIASSAERMTALIKGLLEHSRIGREPKMQMMDFNEAVQQAISDLTATIQESGALIQVDKLPKIYASPTDIHLLFVNLLSNAIKFRCDNRPPVIQVAAKEERTRWKLLVQDNGIGIEERYLKKIFNIFHRVNASDQYAGTGIGLAHCRKIVEMHGGGIWAESSRRKGSTFYFTLPKKSEKR